MSLEKPENLPIGIGGTKLNEVAETLPAIKVGNEVEWVNDEMEAPFDLNPGEETELAVFLTSNQETAEPSYQIEVFKNHHRTGLFGRIIFRDKQGNLYRDVDIKGGGAITGYKKHKSKKKFYAADIEKRNIHNMWTGSQGLLRSFGAETDAENAEILRNYGVRTYRVIATVRLLELVYKGRKIGLDEAKKRGLIESFETPVIEIRAFGTHMRVADAEQKEGIYVDDAIQLVSQELGVETMNVEEYYRWFCITLGRSLRGMFNHYLTNSSLDQKDVTLDCRIVDLDGFRDWMEYPAEVGEGENFLESVASDVRAAKRVLEWLLTHLKKVKKIDMPTFKKLFQQYEGWFNEGYKPEMSQV